MSLVRMNQGSLAFGYIPLLEKADVVIERQERVCLVGRNGAGKSSLMKVFSGDLELDEGELNFAQGLKISRLQQDPPKDCQQSIYEYIATGLSSLGETLARYYQLVESLNDSSDESTMNEMMSLQQVIENEGGWDFDQKIQMICQKLQLNPQTMMSQLSGGWLRKVALARALVIQPDLLLLDEPTNHLDIDTIEWLEQFLLNFQGTIIFISHDRSFIDRLATRMIDLDRGVLTSWPGNYQAYLQGKQQWLEVQQAQQALFDKKLALEETWIRQGVKARRTRNEGRVRALEAMRQERQQRIARQGSVQMKTNQSQRSGKLVFEATQLSFDYHEQTIVRDLTMTVLRGDRIALVGPNGCGKSTIIQLLLESLQPMSGKVRQGTNLEVAYFDQYRQALDEEKTVEENVGQGKQQVMVGGRDRHILSYLQDFLFSPERSRTPVKALSGGEKNRLLLAKLFLQPANVLILDEPTNDLDVETLELLENLLTDFDGTLLMVSHDRAFIDATVTSSWWFTGDGVWQEFLGGYHDALKQGAKFYTAEDAESTTSVVKESVKLASKEAPVESKSKKLSYKLQRELDELPEKMEQLEQEIDLIQQSISQTDFYEQPHDKVQEQLNLLAEKEAALEGLLQRWEELENLK